MSIRIITNNWKDFYTDLRIDDTSQIHACCICLLSLHTQYKCLKMKKKEKRKKKGSKDGQAEKGRCLEINLQLARSLIKTETQQLRMHCERFVAFKNLCIITGSMGARHCATNRKNITYNFLLECILYCTTLNA